MLASTVSALRAPEVALHVQRAIRVKLQQRDRKFLARDSPPEDLILRRTEGNFVYDASGKRSIDLLAGWCVGNFGWKAKHLRRIARPPVDYAYPYYLYEPWVELAELLAALTPGRLQKSFRATGGSEAVDIALQIARAYTKRRKFVSLEDSYHGNTIGTVSIGAKLKSFNAASLERLLKKRDVAAFILEPISCNLGVKGPDAEFMDEAQSLCRKYGTLLIADEVACGFGRTGRLFASEHFDLEPDILCMGKAISGGAAGIGATITTARIANDVSDRVAFYSTYGWHPYSTAVAIANLKWIQKNRDKLLRHVHKLSEYFRSRLNQFEVRIRGLAIAVEMSSEKQAESVVKRCQKNGVLLTTAGTAITMFPPLTIDLETAERALDIFEQSVR